MKLTTRLLLLVFFLLWATASAQETQAQTQQPERDRDTLPRWNIKTNLLYDATTTINLGIEFRLGKKTSFEIPVNYNPWTFGNNKKWKHIMVQPELRFWTKDVFRGHFIGIQGHYAYYNIGRWGWPFSDFMKENRFEGWLAGAGITYGYRWALNYRWAMEATVGVGYAYMDYDRYECNTCGASLGRETKHYFGPTEIGLNLILNLGDRRKPAPTPVPVVTPIVEPVVQSAPPAAKVIEPYTPKIAASFITPAPEAVKARQGSGSAFLDFAAGQSVINPAFRNNAAELGRMNTLLESINNDPNATISGISITGFASPEGTYTTNMTLSERRATALKNYIKSTFGFPETMFRVHGAGEDWAGLEKLVKESNIQHREQVLSIISSTGLFDGRERQLMSLANGVPYRTMLAEMFPKLRRVEYVIDYTVTPFTIDESKQVFQTRPGNLSLNEMFLIANTYAPGSAEFNEVFETAARLFPDSDVANLNAAASALDRRDIISAERYLGRVKEKNDYYWNNMGVLAWLKGDIEGAATAFEQAKAQGSTNAVELKKHLNSLQK